MIRKPIVQVTLIFKPHDVIVFSALLLLLACGQEQPETHLLSPVGPHKRLVAEGLIRGDWRLTADITSDEPSPEVRLFFAASQDLSRRIYWDITADSVKLCRTSDEKSKTLRTEKFRPEEAPWQISVLKRGAYFILQINGKHAATAMHSSGDIDYLAGGGVAGNEPVEATLGIEALSSELKVENLQIVGGTWCLELPDQPILNYGETSWTEGQLFPGTILEVDNGAAYKDEEGYYYMYVNGSDVNALKQESGGIVRIGVAKSLDLINWKLANNGEFLLEGSPGEWDETSIMANGAVIAPDGRIALSYMGWSKTVGKWSGVGLAFSDSPEGPFAKHGAPVLPTGDSTQFDGIHIHEHHLTKFDDRYVCIYTGHNFAAYPGDHIGIAYSSDLIHWTKESQNPVMAPSQVENKAAGKMWDHDHIRGRDLKKIGEYYYLLYEGAMGETDRADMPTHYWDSIGLARAKSLLGPWERHPLNPIIPQQTGDHFDSIWTGWPRTVIKENQVYIYYAAGSNRFAENPHRAATGLRIVPLNHYTSWSDEFKTKAGQQITFKVTG